MPLTAARWLISILEDQLRQQENGTLKLLSMHVVTMTYQDGQDVFNTTLELQIQFKSMFCSLNVSKTHSILGQLFLVILMKWYTYSASKHGTVNTVQ